MAEKKYVVRLTEQERAQLHTLVGSGSAPARRLTHFSPALTDPAAHLDRATAIFPATTLGHDGLTTTLTFEE